VALYRLASCEEGSMTDDLDKLEGIAKAAQERSPGPWRIVNNGMDATRVDGIQDSAPKPDGWETYCGSEWQNNTVLETDGGYYEPKGATAEHIATFSPDAVLRLIARIREIEEWKRDSESDAMERDA
jgi:hypothetical protein